MAAVTVAAGALRALVLTEMAARVLRAMLVTQVIRATQEVALTRVDRAAQVVLEQMPQTPMLLLMASRVEPTIASR